MHFSLLPIPTSHRKESQKTHYNTGHFSLQDLRQIESDLERFPDDLDKYTEIFHGINQILIYLGKTYDVNEPNSL